MNSRRSSTSSPNRSNSYDAPPKVPMRPVFATHAPRAGTLVAWGNRRMAHYLTVEANIGDDVQVSTSIIKVVWILRRQNDDSWKIAAIAEMPEGTGD